MDAKVFGVLEGSADEPRIAYLRADATVGADVMAALPVDPVAVFRFSARCETSRCAQFDGHTCGLGRRIVEGLAPVVDALPPCQIRATCRWYAENLGAACLRCPQVVTLVPRDGSRLSRVAQIKAPSDT
ncbi:hypothetical protein [Roseateles sp. BYS96W]|uniref:Nitrogen fixation protein n=1 Tax=Pelomonas nitida TaxID=3299027 RepID=A0ABW7GCK8_9BURK